MEEEGYRFRCWEGGLKVSDGWVVGLGCWEECFGFWFREDIMMGLGKLDWVFWVMGFGWIMMGNVGYFYNDMVCFFCVDCVILFV